MDAELRSAIAATKQRLRQAIALKRSVRDPAEAARADAGRTARMAELLGDRLGPGLTAACYVSRPSEPGTLALIAMVSAAGGRVLLPSFADSRGVGAPAWAWYAGPEELTAGPQGLLYPTTPPLSQPVVGHADVIVCAAVAGTATGDRLGTGAGWYDRALPWADPTTPVVALLNDDEVLDSLPTEPTDHRVDVIVTELRTIATGT